MKGAAEGVLTVMWFEIAGEKGKSKSRSNRERYELGRGWGKNAPLSLSAKEEIAIRRVGGNAGDQQEGLAHTKRSEGHCLSSRAR